MTGIILFHRAMSDYALLFAAGILRLKLTRPICADFITKTVRQTCPNQLNCAQHRASCCGRCFSPSLVQSVAQIHVLCACHAYIRIVRYRYIDTDTDVDMNRGLDVDVDVDRYRNQSR